MTAHTEVGLASRSITEIGDTLQIGDDSETARATHIASIME